MTIEWGARAGMIAPDETTFAYLEGRPRAPPGADWERAVDRLARALLRRRRDLRHARRRRRRRAGPAGDLGDESRAWSCRSPAAVPDPASFADPDDRSRRDGRSTTWGSGPARRSRTSASTASSSARARTRGSRISARRPRSSRGSTVDPTRHARSSCPARPQVRRQAEAEGLDRIFLEAGFEWRLRRLLDVPRHEPGHPRPRRALRLDLEPELRGPPGPRRQDAPRQPADGGRRGAARPLRRRALACDRGGAGMKPISRVDGRVAVLDRPDVDTDQIIPKQFLKRIERTGYGQYAFFDWRFDEDGKERPGFELNQPQFAGARILLAGRNFGCGSSREHAAWALQDYGFDVVDRPVVRGHLPHERGQGRDA